MNFVLFLAPEKSKDIFVADCVFRVIFLLFSVPQQGGFLRGIILYKVVIFLQPLLFLRLCFERIVSATLNQSFFLKLHQRGQIYLVSNSHNLNDAFTIIFTTLSAILVSFEKCFT